MIMISSYRGDLFGIGGGNLDVSHLLRAEFVGVFELVGVVIAGGEEGPGEVHGGGGEGAAADAKEEGDDDAEDVLGAVAEGAEIGGGRGEERLNPRKKLLWLWLWLLLLLLELELGEFGAVVDIDEEGGVGGEEGTEVADLGEDGNGSRGGGLLAEGEGIGGDPEGFAGPGGGDGGGD